MIFGRLLGDRKLLSRAIQYDGNAVFCIKKHKILLKIAYGENKLKIRKWLLISKSVNDYQVFAGTFLLVGDVSRMSLKQTGP